MPNLTDRTRKAIDRLDAMEAHRAWCRDWRMARRVCRRHIRLGLAEVATLATGAAAIAAHLATVGGV